MWVRWASTVRGETNSSSAILRLVRPSATRSATRRSAAVSSSSADGAALACWLKSAVISGSARADRSAPSTHSLGCASGRRDGVAGRVAPPSSHPRRAQRGRGGGEQAGLPELACLGRRRQPVEGVGGTQRQLHRLAVVEGGEERGDGLLDVAQGQEGPAQEQPGVDAVTAQARGVGEGHDVGRQPGRGTDVAACQQLAGVLRQHRQANRPRQRLADDLGGDPRRVEAPQQGLGQQPDPVLGELTRLEDDGPGARHGLDHAALLERDPRQDGAQRQVDPALVPTASGRHRLGRRGGRLDEAALRRVDVGKSAGGLAADRLVRVEVDGATSLALGASQVAGVEVHLGADRGGLGELLLGARRGGGVLVGPVEQPEPLVGPAHLRGGDAGPSGDLGADRRRAVAGLERRPRGSRRRRGCASRCRGRRRSGWPPSSRRRGWSG